MPTIDNWRALREALDAMCRTVSLHDDEWESREGDTNEWGTLCYEIDCKNNGTSEIATAYGPTTADYIAAAHPAAIRSLLDERDRIEANAERLAAEQAVMRQWIAEAVRELESINSAEAWTGLSALCESGRRLVDGGPDDLLAGVE